MKYNEFSDARTEADDAGAAQVTAGRLVRRKFASRLRWL
jgi:hypothetical protein